jgi:hypothetical protein
MTHEIKAVRNVVGDERAAMLKALGNGLLSDDQRAVIDRVEVTIAGIIADNQHLDIQFGGIELSSADRDYVLDTGGETHLVDEDKNTTFIQMKLDHVDDAKEVFGDESVFNLLTKDLFAEDFKAEIFIDGLGSDGDDVVMPIILDMKLFINVGDEEISIDLTEQGYAPYEHLFYAITYRYTDEEIDEDKEPTTAYLCSLELEEMEEKGYMQASRYNDDDIFHYGISALDAIKSINKDTGEDFMILSVDVTP